MKPGKNASMRRPKCTEGQLRGITRMVEDERYCIASLQQMQAMRLVEDYRISASAGVPRPALWRGGRLYP